MQRDKRRTLVPHPRHIRTAPAGRHRQHGGDIRLPQHPPRKPRICYLPPKDAPCIGQVKSRPINLQEFLPQRQQTNLIPPPFSTPFLHQKNGMPHTTYTGLPHTAISVWGRPFWRSLAVCQCTLCVSLNVNTPCPTFFTIVYK